jgi:hypothetical protein
MKRRGQTLSWVTANTTPWCPFGHGGRTRATHLVKWRYGAVTLRRRVKVRTRKRVIRVCVSTRARVRTYACADHARKIVSQQAKLGHRVCAYPARRPNVS